MKRALLVIDIQNDYFPSGKLPLWNADDTLSAVERAIGSARAAGLPVVLVQHLADPKIAPFLNANTPGADIHPRILEAAPSAPVIVKEFADAFFQTRLEEVLAGLGVSELLVCGMMTQNCVTHTAISKSAEKYQVSILPDCSTTVTEMVHKIALHGVSTRVAVVPSKDAIDA